MLSSTLPYYLFPRSYSRFKSNVLHQIHKCAERPNTKEQRIDQREGSERGHQNKRL